MKINHFIKYHSAFSCLLPQGHSTDTCSSYDGSWEIQTFNKRAFSTITAAFLSTSEFRRRERSTTVTLLSQTLLWTTRRNCILQSKRKTPSMCYINKLNKVIDKPPRQDTTFLTLGCCLAACEDTFLHSFSSLQIVFLNNHPPCYSWVFTWCRIVSGMSYNPESTAHPFQEQFKASCIQISVKVTSKTQTIQTIYKIKVYET